MKITSSTKIECEYSEWTMLDSKQVKDFDDFWTEYTLYKNNTKELYICMFGDRDFYPPDEDYCDFETDSYDVAIEWFESYKGAEEDDDLSWM